ncbi:Uu.00g099620.m01.CDS01 [Anthostomella pinea]|uniref:U3 small nucleolar RNA-associated protein 25 n=1 Tax=Anthostomella pinea TaxID=933095 RepID=A0AAI8V7R6_9PEZI|nr:Uu.00g099620.m01.CDS01 [Anthostomella pinea]
MPPRGKPAGRGGPARGRGKGSGKRSFGGAPKFHTARLAQIEESDSEGSDEGSPSEEEPESEASESDEDEVQPTQKPYLALMESLAKESSAAHSAKRRKLDHQPKKSQAASNAEPDEGSPSDDGDEETAEQQDVDRVEDPEEEPDEGIVIGEDDGEEEIPDASDPFETHFVTPDESEFIKRLKGIQSDDYQPRQNEQNGWRLTTSIPGKDSSQTMRLPTTIPGPSALKLKQRLVESANKKRPNFDKLEQILYPLAFGYHDLLFCGRNVKNAESLRRMACLHAVNHIFKTRDRVIKNNAKLAKEGEDTEFEPRDQGFTRPKVLMLLPTRQSAVNMVNTICALCEPEQQENRKRFDDSYIDKEVKFTIDRPEDFRELFEGNDDDMFRIGVKFTRKTIKYFSQFYSSDILIASPLGLRMAIGAEEGDGDKKKAAYDYDFLSSIELVVVDQADALLMQNWEHVEHVFAHLNLQPRDAHGCDFGRVREWYLEKQAAHFRQTLVFSAFNTPELAELHRRGVNWAGRARVQPASYAGAIQDLGGVRAKQTFSRFEAPSAAAEPDARFAYFVSAIIPTMVKRARDMAGTLIFVPSYLDFVRVRNYFATADAVASLTFGAVSEYASVAEASRARSHFLSGRHRVLLYTERAHHFRRYALRGVSRVVFYGLPDNPVFYREIAGGYLGRSEQDLKIEPGQGTVRVMFSKYDVLRLERIVGSKRVGKMVREKGDTFDFV